MTVLSFRFMNSVTFSQVVLTYRRLSFVIIISNVLAFKQLIATCYICSLLLWYLTFLHDEGEDMDVFCGPIMNISL